MHGVDLDQLPKQMTIDSTTVFYAKEKSLEPAGVGALLTGTFSLASIASACQISAIESLLRRKNNSCQKFSANFATEYL